MATETPTATAEAEIRDLVERFARAYRANDLEAVLALYAPEIVSFDAIGGLVVKGWEAYKAHWAWCMSACEGHGIVYELRDVEVEAGEDLAVSRYLARCGITLPDGTEHTSWLRGTVVYRKRDGAWKIVHEHYSAPFDPESGKAMLDAAP